MIDATLVRSIRSMVVEQGMGVADVHAAHPHISKAQIHSIVAGRSYAAAGGPIRPSTPRLRGERRVCTRCRLHKNEDAFVVKLEDMRGICTPCAKPEDIERAMSRRSRAAIWRQRQEAKRAQLRAEIEQLSTPPWGTSVLSPADVAELDAKRTEILRSKRVCQAGWGKTA